MNINNQKVKEDMAIAVPEEIPGEIMNSHDADDLNIQRGDIVYISSMKDDNDDSVMNHGYAIVCSNNSNNLFSPVVEVVFLSRQKKAKNLPTHFWIMLGKIAYVAHCEQVTSVTRDRIERRRGRISEAERKMLHHCLMISLGL